jgi:hypothetical protein
VLGEPPKGCSPQLSAYVSGEIGQDAFGRVDAYLVPILYYLRTTLAGGSMLATKARISEYLEHNLVRSSVQATMPPPLERPDARSVL